MLSRYFFLTENYIGKNLWHKPILSVNNILPSIRIRMELKPKQTIILKAHVRISEIHRNSSACAGVKSSCVCCIVVVLCAWLYAQHAFAKNPLVWALSFLTNYFTCRPRPSLLNTTCVNWFIWSFYLGTCE